jgi:CubicO group peptidase (beta-lactamase class C family)
MFSTSTIPSPYSAPPLTPSMRYWEPYGEARTVTRMDPYRAEYGRFIGYEANGSWGQYLVIYPDQRLVAVRMMAVTEKTNVTDSFDNFHILVRALVPGTK